MTYIIFLPSVQFSSKPMRLEQSPFTVVSFNFVMLPVRHSSASQSTFSLLPYCLVSSSPILCRIAACTIVNMVIIKVGELLKL